MNVSEKMALINKIVTELAPLDSGDQHEVIEIACKLLKVAHPQSTKTEQERPFQNPPTLSSRASKPIPPQQYLRDYGYKVMTKRIGVLAVYLEREKGMKRFNFKDVTDSFRDAKEPKTPAQSQYARAVVMGYLAKEGDQFYATSKAEKLVDSYKDRQSEEFDENEP